MLSMSELRELPDDELKEISLRKNSKGNATIEANRATLIRNERSGHWSDIKSKSPSYDAMLIAEKGTMGFVKKFR